MPTNEIIYLIENAEQGGDLDTIETGAKARAQLNELRAVLEQIVSDYDDLGRCNVTQASINRAKRALQE
jgi:hypothetical protein